MLVFTIGSALSDGKPGLETLARVERGRGSGRIDSNSDRLAEIRRRIEARRYEYGLRREVEQQEEEIFDNNNNGGGEEGPPPSLLRLEVPQEQRQNEDDEYGEYDDDDYYDQGDVDVGGADGREEEITLPEQVTTEREFQNNVGGGGGDILEAQETQFRPVSNCFKAYLLYRNA